MADAVTDQLQSLPVSVFWSVKPETRPCRHAGTNTVCTAYDYDCELQQTISQHFRCRRG